MTKQEVLEGILYRLRLTEEEVSRIALDAKALQRYLGSLINDLELVIDSDDHDELNSWKA